MDKESDALPAHYRWNFTAFVVDYICFMTALSLVSVSSVMPAFVRQLTDSAPVIGLSGAIFRGSWLLPQLAVARLVGHKPRKKPYMVVGLYVRIVFWVVALGLWVGLARYPTAMLVLFFVCLSLFAFGDGVTNIAWSDILARTIPPKRRGRLFGLGQLVSGLTGIGMGALVGLILGSPRLAFPTNYALLFALSGALFIPSALALGAVREPPPQDTTQQTRSLIKGRWLALLLKDPDFRRIIVCQLLVGTMDLAIPFYVGHATDALRLPQRIIGTFVIAQTLAGLFASGLLGLINDRWGPRYVVRIGSAAAVMGPLFALAAHLDLTSGLLAQAYPVTFVLLGVVRSARMLGFLNYVLEIAPDEMRPAYVGLSNTLTGVIAVAPLIGGWLLQTTSYVVLFAVTAASVATGFLLSLKVRSPQPATLVEHQP